MRNRSDLPLSIFILRFTLPFIAALAFAVGARATADQNSCGALAGAEPQDHVLAGSIQVTRSEYRFIQLMKERGALFRTPEFWEFYSARPELVRELLTNWYSYREDALNQIRWASHELGEKYGLLFLDPGIAQRAVDFVGWARNSISLHPDVTPFQLRLAYSDHVQEVAGGPVEVWRGTLMYPHQAYEVRHTTGIKGNAFRMFSGHSQNSYDAKVAEHNLVSMLLNKHWSGHRPNSPYSEMLSRLGGATQRSFYTSCSLWKQATSAGAWGGRRTQNPIGDGQFHLFRIHISPLNLVRPDGIFSGIKSDEWYSSRWDGHMFSMSRADPGFEMFLQYVAPSEIQEMIRFEVLPPRWF